MGGGGAVVQHYSMVKIPYAEWGDTRTQLWRRGQGQTERERTIEDQIKG